MNTSDCYQFQLIYPNSHKYIIYLSSLLFQLEHNAHKIRILFTYTPHRGDIRNEIDADITSYLENIIAGNMADNTLMMLVVISPSVLRFASNEVISDLIHQCIVYYIYNIKVSTYELPWLGLKSAQNNRTLFRSKGLRALSVELLVSC